MQKKLKQIVKLSHSARTRLEDALVLANERNFERATEKLQQAQNLLKDAEMLQKEIDDEDVKNIEYLFSSEHLASSQTTLLLTQQIIQLIEAQQTTRQKKLRIMLICASGMSSGMLMKKMKEWSAEHGQDIHVQSFGIAEYLKYIDDYDIILVGPQMNHHVKNIAATIKQPVSAIPPLDFAVGNIDNIMKMIDSLLKQNVSFHK